VRTRRYGAIKLGSKTNVALLGLLAIAFLTGWLAFAFGTAPARLSLIVHATGGVAILLLLPWKSMIARRGLARPRGGRWASIGLGMLVLLSIAAGLGHSTGLVLSWGPFSSMEVHVGAALAAIPLAVWHVVARRVKVVRADLSRRTFMKGSVALGAAAVSYAASEILVRAATLPGGARRFTGSYEAGSFQPAVMPVSSWMFDAIPVHDPDAWTLRTPGREWSLRELATFDDRMIATLDCTGGFYSTQEWTGVRLDRLLPEWRSEETPIKQPVTADRFYWLGESRALRLPNWPMPLEPWL